MVAPTELGVAVQGGSTQTELGGCTELSREKAEFRVPKSRGAIRQYTDLGRTSQTGALEIRREALSRLGLRIDMHMQN